MVETHSERTLLSGYQLHLPAFEGPLDVLLRLIERSELAIEDVSLVAVTGQFLTLIDDMADAPPGIVADFTAVGARLTVLKSRSLLPKPAVVEEEHEQSDLTHQLRAYKRIKDIARHLGDVHAAGLHAYTAVSHGAVVSPVSAQAIRLAHHEPELLMRSLRRRLGVAPKPAQFIKQRRVISLRQVVSLISDLVGRARIVRFSTVVSDYRTRTEVATAFLAVLILVRRQSVDASQARLFGDISLESSPRSQARQQLNGAYDDHFVG